jgi:hypothetical protein
LNGIVTDAQQEDKGKEITTVDVDSESDGETKAEARTKACRFSSAIEFTAVRDLTLS